ncbi:amino acid ABC transporter substrate-binding protein [Aestuariibacter sp. GS-14]|uniref:transporter substrate-binding domain-containing protein n=1 Tax=Aestuariibacter sp. GS-14 TaxID=2590670 RepID=UPI00112B9A81|nr:transporter substrate-binding domain-containing protein [Aestuariibacter sp. GS-14]TPV57785.1 amino acid ABC transporter substrate-binding protein [Aestuariibacter sp. GS-14]
MKKLSVFVVLITLFVPRAQASEPGEVIFTRAFADDAYGYYHAQILQRILELTPEFGKAVAVPHPQPMPQARQIIKLQAGEGDVMWSATSNEREQQLLPVRFPLLQGLAGYRVLVINAYKQAQYPTSLTKADLQNLVGVQGNDWPDLTVLRHNGFKVEGAQWSLWFQTMFTAVEKGMVDYFPRNVIEVSNDLERHEAKRIKLEDNFILRYPSYEYFFVSPLKPELVNRLQIGLLRMLNNGELKVLFEKHDNHKKAMLLATDPSRIMIELNNPDLAYKYTNPLWGNDATEMRQLLEEAILKSTQTDN